MGKIINYYNQKDRIDKAWYNSSNVVYSECNDMNNEYKSVKIIFKNGSTYEYYDVNVNDYVMFREDSSQGSAINKYIKKYKYEKLKDSDLENIDKELNDVIKMTEEFKNSDHIVSVNNERIRSFHNNRLSDVDVSTHDATAIALTINVLLSLGIRVKIEE